MLNNILDSIASSNFHLLFELSLFKFRFIHIPNQIFNSSHRTGIQINLSHRTGIQINLRVHSLLELDERYKNLWKKKSSNLWNRRQMNFRIHQRWQQLQKMYDHLSHFAKQLQSARLISLHQDITDNRRFTHQRRRLTKLLNHPHNFWTYLNLPTL